VLYHVDYTLYGRADMIREFSIDIFLEKQ
jgi:hypothetical protein